MAASAHDAAPARWTARAAGAKAVTQVMRTSLRANGRSVKATFSADATAWRRRCGATRAAAGAARRANGRPRARAAPRRGGSAAWGRAPWAQSGRASRGRQGGRRLSAMAGDHVKRSRAGARVTPASRHQRFTPTFRVHAVGARHAPRARTSVPVTRTPARAGVRPRRLRRVPAPSPARWRARRRAWRRRCPRPWPCRACRRPCRRPAAPRS